MLITVVTQLPECYERALTFTTEKPSSVICRFAETRALAEVPFGLIWGSLSWLLYLGGLKLFRRFPVPNRLKQRGILSPSLVWPVFAATVSIAALEGLILGWPLAGLYSGFVNTNLPPGDYPFVMVSDRSIMVGALGIVSAFVLPTLAAGYATAHRGLYD